MKNELNKVNEKYAEVLEEATGERKKQLQKATTTRVEELLSNTEAEEEEGRGPEGTVDTVTPTSKSVPTAISTPTNSFEGVVPASTSKRKDITTKTSPYFNPTFSFYYTHSNHHIDWVNEEKHYKENNSHWRIV